MVDDDGASSTGADRPTLAQRRVWMGMARVVARLSRSAHLAVRERHGIGLSELTMLGQVRAIGTPARLGELARGLDVSKAAVTKLVDSLETRGHLDRSPDPDDRRAVLASLTPSGRLVLTRAEATFETHLQEGLWSHLSSREVQVMADALDHVQDELGVGRSGVLPPRS